MFFYGPLLNRLAIKIITDHIGSLPKAPEFFEHHPIRWGSWSCFQAKNRFFWARIFFLKKFVHSCQIYQNVHALILFILTHTYLKSVDPFKSCDSFFKDRQNVWFLFWEQKILYFWVQKQIIWLLTWKEDKFCTNMLEISHWYM